MKRYFQATFSTAILMCLSVSPLCQALEAPASQAETIEMVSPQTPTGSDATLAPDMVPVVPIAPTMVPPPQATIDTPSPVSITLDSTSPSAVPTLPAPVAANDAILISAFQFRQNVGFDFIELHNTTNEMTKLSGLTIKLLYSTTSDDYECQIEPAGYLLPGSYMTYRHGSDSSDGTYGMSGCPDPGAGLFDKEIQVWRDGSIVESVRIAEADMGGQAIREWERGGWTSTYRTGEFARNFKVSTRVAYTSMAYQSPPAPSLQFLEVFPTPSTCMVQDMSPTCHKYVKLKNTGGEPINLADFRLRSGDPNSRSTSSNTSALDGVIGPAEYKVIVVAADGMPLAINGTEGTVWLEDVYGLAKYASSVSPYAKADLVANAGRSWAFDDVDLTWKWGVPAPLSEENTFTDPGEGAGMTMLASTLKPCADNQYRSTETNRCRLMEEAASSTLKPCKDGQYRSEETNRCRSIAATAASVLKPCGDDQFRNPATGRCKMIASTDDLPKPCPTGQERNPSTNRCRKTVSDTPPLAAFPVEPIRDTTKAFAAWWALGGILFLGLGYGVWEWRYEIGRLAMRAATVVRRQ